MVKRMTKFWACIVAILLAVSILSLNVSAINTDDTIAYGYTTLSATFKSPFRTSSSGTTEEDKIVNEKYSQMRLWKGANADTHEGIDITAKHGTDVFAVYPGTVKIVNTSNSNLRFVIIEHTISSSKVYSVYVHLDEIYVSEGDSVKDTTRIATSGPPTNSTYGYHLHFGLTSNYSTKYSELIWLPSYNFFKNSSCFNNGKDLDYIYGVTYSNSTHVIKASGYFKGDSTKTREAFDHMYLYYRTGSTGDWNKVEMTSTSVQYQFMYDLDDLGLSSGTTVNGIVVGEVTSTIDSNNGGLHWQYSPAKVKVPPRIPASTGGYNSFRLPLTSTYSNGDLEYEPWSVDESMWSIQITI